jgi:hypothetical protein
MLALAYQLFAALCGWLEAILYAQRAAESFTFNEHAGMLAQRVAALLLAPVAVLVYHWLGWWAFVELVPMALLFPAAHDEAYNFTRLWLACRAALPADYDKGDSTAWKTAWGLYRYGYQSPTTTARNDFNGRARTWLAIAGGVVLVVLYVFILHPFSLFTHG